MDLNIIDKTANLSKNNSMSLMVFKLVGHQDEQFGVNPFYAMNIFKIKEVLNASEYKITKTTMNAADYYKGVIEVRGDYINVYDTAQWFGHQIHHANERSVIVISEVNNQTIGLLVAYIHGVAEKDWKEIQSSGENSQKIVSQTRVEDELCLIMDVEQMIAEITGTDLEKEAKVKSLGESFSKIILFADDQGSIRGYVKAVLENLGFEHQIYEDGSGIIQFLESKENHKKVGLIITDLEMPNVSGHTVIRTVKEVMRLDIPVVVHSSMTVGDSVRQANQLGADGFIGKIDTAELVKAIKQYYKA